MTPDDRYRVDNSGAVAEQFRQLAAEAKQRGHLKLFMQAANWIIEKTGANAVGVWRIVGDKPGF